jgi:Uma2 family endonuclease
MHLTITNDRIDLPPGGEVILRHQTWLDYEKLLESRQDKAAIKIYFDAETQEIRIMAPLPGHGKKSDTLSDLVKALLRYQGQDWDSFDPITLKRFEQAGLEPDACFYIQNRQAILGKERIDLETDPPPDLALEIDLTSSTKPKIIKQLVSLNSGSIGVKCYISTCLMDSSINKALTVPRSLEFL